MAKLSNQAYKYITPAKPFSLPKLPQARPMSSGSAARAGASSYGKIPKVSGGSTKTPMQSGS